jgi:hypothetical protein
VIVAGVQVPDVTPVVPLQRGSLAKKEVSERFKAFLMIDLTKLPAEDSWLVLIATNKDIDVILERSLTVNNNR